MRKPEYISPSALKTWRSDEQEYYLRYLSDHKPARFPQTRPMAVGSAFDALVKSKMFLSLFGIGHPKAPIYEERTIFEAQVEEHNRDWAWEEGRFVFDRYVKSGCLADLMLEVGSSATDPQFEISVLGTIESRKGTVKGGVPIYGKPDVFFINQQGCPVVLDWKVRGYCAKQDTTPTQGYKMSRDTWSATEYPNSRSHWTNHKRWWGVPFKGMEINGMLNLEDVSEDWAIQLSSYAWILGEQVGVEVVTAIDEITGIRPKLRISQHRTKVTSAYQQKVIGWYHELWDRVTTGHFFRDLSREDSDRLCKTLDAQSEVMFQNPDFSALVNTQVYRPK